MCVCVCGPVYRCTLFLGFKKRIKTHAHPQKPPHHTRLHTTRCTHRERNSPRTKLFLSLSISRAPAPCSLSLLLTLAPCSLSLLPAPHVGTLQLPLLFLSEHRRPFPLFLSMVPTTAAVLAGQAAAAAPLLWPPGPSPWLPTTPSCPSWLPCHPTW
jgi:hypothetical protein